MNVTGVPHAIRPLDLGGLLRGRYAERGREFPAAAGPLRQLHSLSVSGRQRSPADTAQMRSSATRVDERAELFSGPEADDGAEPEATASARRMFRLSAGFGCPQKPSDS